jgi:hypothetical protein
LSFQASPPSLWAAPWWSVLRVTLPATSQPRPLMSWLPAPLATQQMLRSPLFVLMWTSVLLALPAAPIRNVQTQRAATAVPARPAITLSPAMVPTAQMWMSAMVSPIPAARTPPAPTTTGATPVHARLVTPAQMAPTAQMWTSALLAPPAARTPPAQTKTAATPVPARLVITPPPALAPTAWMWTSALLARPAAQIRTAQTRRAASRVPARLAGSPPPALAPTAWMWTSALLELPAL